MSGLASRSPGSPASLVAPGASDPDDRRAIAGATTGNSPPTDDTPGFPTRCHRWLHVEVLSKVGTSVAWRLWSKRTGMSDKWGLDTRIGSSPSWSEVVTTAGAENGSPSILEIDGWDRVYVEVLTFVGGGEAVDVWLGASGVVDG